jgi:integrase
MPVHPNHPGVDVRPFLGAPDETFSVRYTDVDGSKPRRSFDTLDDALDFQAKHRSDKRWRPEELRRERAGQKLFGDFFLWWWEEYALIELARSTLSTYRSLWHAHAEERIAHVAIRDIDPPFVVGFRNELIRGGVGTESIIKTMSLLQRVFRDAVELGEAPFNPFKAVKKPASEPTSEAIPLTPLQVELLVADLSARGYGMSAVLVRLLAYTGLRPQEALALDWRHVRELTLLVEFANSDGKLVRLKNRKRGRKRSRTVDIIKLLKADLSQWRKDCGNPGDGELVFQHEEYGGLWLDEHYRTWRRRIYKPSAENVGLPTLRPYDLRHTWASLLIAEKRLSIAEVAEQLGDKASTILDTYTHVINEYRGCKAINIDLEIEKARRRVG